MALSKRKRRQITLSVLGISAITWLVLLVNPGGTTFQHCPVAGIPLCSEDGGGLSPFALDLLLAVNPIPSLIAGWALMLVAMMSPLLIGPILHVMGQNFKRRRWRSVSLFLIGYFTVWMVVGIFSMAMVLMLFLLIPQYLGVAALVAGIIAVIWQCTPFKQRCLNRNHYHRSLASFGWLADRDALKFGLTHGAWCVGSCWALMLFPMLLPQGHILAMFIVTYVMIAGHLEHPEMPRWKLRFPKVLWRAFLYQTRLGMKRLSKTN